MVAPGLDLGLEELVCTLASLVDREGFLKDGRPLDVSVFLIAGADCAGENCGISLGGFGRNLYRDPWTCVLDCSWASLICSNMQNTESIIY